MFGFACVTAARFIEKYQRKRWTHGIYYVEFVEIRRRPLSGVKALIADGRVLLELCHFRRLVPVVMLGRLVTSGPFWQSSSGVFCRHGCTALFHRGAGPEIAGRIGGCKSSPGADGRADHVADRPAGERGPRVGVAGPGLPGNAGDVDREEVEDSSGANRASACRAGAAFHELAG